MRTEDMEYILAVYRSRSISGAAEQLNISSQGLGKAIKSVEKLLGCTLFQRSFQGVMPTPLCEAIVDKLAKIVEMSAQLQEIIDDFPSHNDAVETILIMESVLSSIVEKIICQYNEQYGKRIHIELRPVDLEERFETIFENNSYDYRICTKELIRNDIYQTFQLSHLHFHPLVNARCHLSEKASVSVGDFDGMTLLIERRRPYVYSFLNLCQEQGVHVQIEEAYDKFYLSRLLSENDNCFYLGQRADIYRMVRLGSFILLSMEPAFGTTIVVQSRNGIIDPRLLNMIRSGLSGFSDQYLD